MNKRPRSKPGTLKRVFKMLKGYYPRLLPLVVGCILFSALVAAIPDVLIQKVVAIIEKWQSSGDWSAASKEVWPIIVFLAVMYILSLIAVTVYTQLMAVMTQGFLYKLRKTMFDGMQELPISYFDTHRHGDIMSYYTNDIDTLRQLVSQTIPAVLRAGAVVIGVLCVMLYYSVWLTLILLLGVVLMFLVSKKVGGGSAKYFIRQQQSMGKTEGFIQEMMSGQKVVKVFCHEDESKEDFRRINSELFGDSFRANAYANCLGPILNNIGNVLYVVIAVAGGLFILGNVPNLSVSGLAFSVSVVVPFLNMARQFSGNVNQLSQQINSIVMAMAGAERIFALMDELPESDDGKVTLVNAEISPDGSIRETDKHSGHWAWKRPMPDGSFEYTELRGDVRL